MCGNTSQLLLVTGVFWSLAVTSTLRAQSLQPSVITRTIRLIDADDSDEELGAVADRSSRGQMGESPHGKPQSRLEYLQSMQYDRRPAAILRAWAEVNGVKPIAPKNKIDKPKPEVKKPAEDAQAKEAAAKAKEAEALQTEMRKLQADVTLGRWAEVKTYLAGLPKEEQAVAWPHLVESLASPSLERHGQGTPQESNTWTVDDFLGLVGARTQDLDETSLNGLAQILSSAFTRDLAIEAVSRRFKTLLKEATEPALLTPLQMAQLLQSAGQPLEASTFLPSLEEALATKDVEALHLLSTNWQARHAEQSKASDLELAWEANEAILELNELDQDARQRALKRALELVALVPLKLGQAWLDSSFDQTTDRGIEILAGLGETAAQGFETRPRNPHDRLQTLTLQNSAVAALLKTNPDRARSWRPTLRMLALNWLREAEYAQQHEHSTRSNHMQSDQFGNVYFARMNHVEASERGERQPDPIPAEQLLEQAPGQAWSEFLDPGVMVPIKVATIGLLLKLNREEQAFPLIEQIASDYSERAEGLAGQFLSVWKQNHDPNSNRPERYMNPFYFYYGFNERAQSIPLTRSKQERNLVELAGWVARLKQLKLKHLNEELLIEAFTTCHSNAEVYRLEAITRVFGPVEQLEPKTLGAITEQMRQNLAGLWRQPAAQEMAKTRRKTKDIQVEVLRGYAVARDVITQGIAKYPEEWSLHLVQAALELDESNFRQELNKDPSFQQRRQRAMAGFAKAAELYVARAPQLTPEKESTRVFQQWFYASLGAPDLESVDDDKQPDPKQAMLVREKLAALPGKIGERHRDQFAAELFKQLRSVKPAIKFRYLREGFAIVGEHPLAHDARKTYDYYQDLVSELRLEAVVDLGSDGNAAYDGIVGHGRPFGVFVNLRHTPEIERESGGFGRFLQNQNHVQFAVNFGRPTVDYRDRFSAMVQEALRENFEVLSITFQTDKVHAKESATDDWRITPYAYLLLKARGPQIDKLPPLKLDMDFLDTAGYVVLPIESPAVPLDARAEGGPARAVEQLAVTQTLDERQANEGKLLLEVKATARGLVPDLRELLDMKFAGFRTGKIEDRGLAVLKFDDEAPRVAILSERSWLVTLDATQGPVARDMTFDFATAQSPQTKMTWQRYQDVDLQPVEKTVVLQASYGQRDVPWLWIVAGTLSILALIAVVVTFVRRLRPLPVQVSYDLPDPLTPFSVLGLLTELRQSRQFPGSRSADLTRAIADLEHHYFSQNAHGNGDLRVIAETWIREASTR